MRGMAGGYRFEVGERADMPVPLECDYDQVNGQTVLRLRNGARVTPKLVQAMNDCIGGEGVSPPVPPPSS